MKLEEASDRFYKIQKVAESKVGEKTLIRDGGIVLTISCQMERVARVKRIKPSMSNVEGVVLLHTILRRVFVLAVGLVNRLK